MKKNNSAFITLSSIVLVISCLFANCTKTTNEKKGLVIEPEKINVMPLKCDGLPQPCLDPECSPYFSCEITQTYGGVSVTYEKTTGMIRFNSISDANNVIEKLTIDDSIWNHTNDLLYPGYSVDQLDSIDAVTNFDEFKKFRDFEGLFTGFTSKRKNLEITENSWLANNLTGTDPDSQDFTFDNAENTIFNSQNKFKIGTNIYEIKSNGIYINNVLQGGAVELYSVNANPCIHGRNSSPYTDPATGKKYKLKVAVHSIGFRGSAKGKVVSLKQKSGGGWKRSRSEMAILCGGTIYTPSCFLNFSFGIRKPTPSGYLKRKELKVAYREYGAGGQVIYRTKSNVTQAIFQIVNGFSANIYLN